MSQLTLTVSVTFSHLQRWEKVTEVTEIHNTLFPEHSTVEGTIRNALLYSPEVELANRRGYYRLKRPVAGERAA